MEANPEAFRRPHRLEDAFQIIPSDIDNDSHGEQRAAGPDTVFAKGAFLFRGPLGTLDHSCSPLPLLVAE